MHAWQNFGVRHNSSLMSGVYFGTVLESAALSSSAATSAASTITLSVDPSRLTGVAPLAVFFDATATTSTQTTRPIHDVGYYWEFGDGSAGTWTNGTGANTSKNLAYGPVAAHVFETAGTFPITLTCHDGVSTTTTVVATIEVASADTEFAGTKTVCYSETGDFTGAPSGCVQVTVAGTTNDAVTKFAANIGAGNKRHLWRAGETFTLAGSLAANVGGGANHFGKFGSGAKPVFVATTAAPVVAISSTGTPTGVSDWRFVDFDIDCAGLETVGFNGSGSASDILIHGVSCDDTIGGLSLSGSQLDAYNAASPYPANPHAMWDKVFFVDSAITSLRPGLGANGLFLNSRRMAVMGSSIDTNGGGEHGIRTQFIDRGVFSNNTITGVIAGKHHLTIRGTNFNGTNSLSAGNYTEKVVVSDNKFAGGVNAEIMTMASQFPSANERGRNLIVERNWFDGSTDATYMVKSAFIDVTVRNNVAYYRHNGGGNFVNAKDEDTSGVFFPTRVHVYNNSIYHGASGTSYFSLFEAIGNSVTLVGSVFECRNNILYAPGVTAGMSISSNSSGSVATINASNNSPSAATTPYFTTNPPTAIAHFAITNGASYAAGGGTNVKNWSDMYGTNTDTTPDMGAVRIA